MLITKLTLNTFIYTVGGVLSFLYPTCFLRSRAPPPSTVTTEAERGKKGLIGISIPPLCQYARNVQGP
jgi:hypothetical protein